MKYRVAAVSAFFLLLPAAAYANMGTPLMFVSFLHLAVGNMLIGIVEGVFIARVFKRHPVACIAAMIAANYTSAWVGWMLLPFLGSPVVEAIPTDFHNVRAVVTAGMAGAYVATLVLEWPFVALCFIKADKWFRKSVVATLVSQTASYAVLVGLYWLISPNSLVTDLELVELHEMSPPSNALVAYISEGDGDVYTRSLGGGQETRVADLNSTEPFEQLYVRPSEDNDTTWDLVALVANADTTDWEGRVLKRHLPWQGADEWREMDEMDWKWAANRSLKMAYKLGDAVRSPVEFGFGYYPFEGLRAHDSSTGQTVRFALENPFAAWFIPHATQLPGDFVVAQIDEQICLIDYHGRKVAVIARGRGPVTVLTGPE